MDNTAPQIRNIESELDACRALVAVEMDRVNDLIREKLSSEVALINQVSTYIINNGGKRLRPQLVLLAAGACDYRQSLHINLAAIIEFIHTATLLHDDVVDDSGMRRGQDTANAVWGNEAAVLVGDFLYSRSFEMMVEVGSLNVMDILAATTNRIAEGEVMQLLNVNDPDTTEDKYIEVVRAKTARLFEAATRLGGVLAEVSPGVETALASYGRHLGTAFQIADDVLDYTSDASELGKNIGDDLAEGKPTLPLIVGMREGNESQKRIIADAICEGGRNNIEQVCAVIEATGALDISMQTAQAEAQLAQQALLLVPKGKYRDAMHLLADYSVARLN